MQRDDKGKWMRGVSGNPSGRPKGAARRIRSLCQDAVEDIVRDLIQIALDPNQRARDRISAASIILERGLGKPTPELPDEEEPADLKTRVLRLINPETRLSLGLGSGSKPPLPISDSSADENS